MAALLFFGVGVGVPACHSSGRTTILRPGLQARTRLRRSRWIPSTYLPYGPLEVDLDIVLHKRLHPSFLRQELRFGPIPRPQAHLMGTAYSGRERADMLLYGTRISSRSGSSRFRSTSIGICIGAVAGYFGPRRHDDLAGHSRACCSSPSFFLSLTLVALIDRASTSSGLGRPDILADYRPLTPGEFLKQPPIELRLRGPRPLGAIQRPGHVHHILSCRTRSSSAFGFRAVRHRGGHRHRSHPQASCRFVAVRPRPAGLPRSISLLQITSIGVHRLRWTFDLPHDDVCNIVRQQPARRHDQDLKGPWRRLITLSHFPLWGPRTRRPDRHPQPADLTSIPDASVKAETRRRASPSYKGCKTLGVVRPEAGCGCSPHALSAMRQSSRPPAAFVGAARSASTGRHTSPPSPTPEGPHSACEHIARIGRSLMTSLNPSVTIGYQSPRRHAPPQEVESA